MANDDAAVRDPLGEYDANGNITRVEEAWTGAPNNWRTDFTFDYENRLTQVQGSTVVGGTVYTWNTVSHSYDGLGRRLKTTAGGTNYGHIYDGMKLAGNRNLGTSTDGTAWVNAVNDARPLASLSIATTGATRYYSVSDERDPVRRTYTSGGTAGDTSQQSRYGGNVGAVRELPDRAQHAAPLHFNSAAPAYTFFGPRGTKQSEVFPVRSLTFTENDVALPAERGNLEYAGLSLVYEGNRVKSALLGRDLNPLGRGDGIHYFAGAMRLRAATPNVGRWFRPVGSGNSVNNSGQATGCGDSHDGKQCVPLFVPIFLPPGVQPALPLRSFHPPQQPPQKPPQQPGPPFGGGNKANSDDCEQDLKNYNYYKSLLKNICGCEPPDFDPEKGDCEDETKYFNEGDCEKCCSEKCGSRSRYIICLGTCWATLTAWGIMFASCCVGQARVYVRP